MPERVGHRTAEAYYNVERMLMRVGTEDAKILLCATCIEARGTPRLWPVQVAVPSMNSQP